MSESHFSTMGPVCTGCTKGTYSLIMSDMPAISLGAVSEKTTRLMESKHLPGVRTRAYQVRIIFSISLKDIIYYT